MDGCDIQILDMRSPGHPVMELRGHIAPINAIGWGSAEQPLLATAGELFIVCLFVGFEQYEQRTIVKCFSGILWIMLKLVQFHREIQHHVSTPLDQIAKRKSSRILWCVILLQVKSQIWLGRHLFKGWRFLTVWQQVRGNGWQFAPEKISRHSRCSRHPCQVFASQCCACISNFVIPLVQRLDWTFIIRKTFRLRMYLDLKD